MKINRLHWMILLGLLLQSAWASAWWNDEWAFRKQIQVDVSGLPKTAADGTPVALPVVVRLHTGNFQYFGDMQPDGKDLRFLAADEKTPLNFHIETFDPVGQTALIWVYLPYSAGAVVNGALTLESIWMYYGNALATPAADRKATYGVEYGLVYHFEGQGVPTDAGPYGNEPASANSELLASGYIGQATQFKGNMKIAVNQSPSLTFDPAKGLDLSMWLKVDNAQPEAVIAELAEGADSVQLLIDGLVVYARVKFASGQIETAKVPTLVPGAWQHVGVRLEKEQVSVLLEGKQAAFASVSLPAFSGRLSLGSKLDGGASFIGQMDEVVVRNPALDAAVYQRIVETQSVTGNVVSYGGDEQAGAEGTSEADYFTAIMNSVTLDGWVVIIIMTLMFVMCIYIVVGKLILLSRIRKDNAAFLGDYRKLDPNTPDALDRDDKPADHEMDETPVLQALFGKHDHYQSSTLYKLYHVGMQELTGRIGRSLSAQASGLSPQSIDAIKAALDASMIREQQRLNSGMVMLTISVSGGPFLGLLGTVLGVMMTFAAIALSGEVDINGIAPGVSGALLATVVGLAVAIPALFAYNYLSTHIRDITIDMRVFVDELVARIAEFHRQ